MHPSSGPVHRVKVYKLKADGQWDDKGTGHVSVEVLQRQESLGLVVVSEDDTRKPLLIHRISQGEISYERQGDTILTWNDLQLRTDVALSFEETSGCEAVWDAIDQVQKGSYHGQGHSDSPVSRHMVDEYDQVQHHQDGQMSEMCPSGPVELPAPEMGNLEEITRILTELQVQQKESMAAFLRKDGYIKRLLDLFQQLEDLENQEGLTLMFRSVKSIILLNDSALYEELLKEDNVMHVVGALEYDPDVGRCNHREFLRDKVLFKEVIPIADGEVKAKIHQTYRMGYLKDVILPRVLDDSTFAMIHSMMMFNCMDILQSLHADATYLNQLFQQLREQKPSEPHWEDLVSFTQELCSLAKHLQPHLRAELFTRLLDLGLLEVEEKILEHGGPEVRLKATDILLSLIQHDPSPLRAYMVKHNSLLDLLVQDILAGGDSGLAEQNIQLLKILLDEETMEQNQDKNLFMDLFYNSFIGKLLVAIGPAGSSSGSAAREAVAAAAKADGDAAGTAGPGTRPAGDAAVGAGRTMSAHVIGLIVDLLSFCVQHHKYRIKYYALKNGLLARVLHLIKRPEKWLVVAAIRFLKICIGMKDEFYIRDVLRNNLLDPVINAFVANGDRYNLLNSTVLELVEFIRKETVTKRLVAYICEQPHWQEPLCGITYVDTFKQLRERYDSDQISALDADGKGTDAAARSEWLEQRRRRGPREMEKDEEDYFSERSDDEDTATAHPTSARPAAARAQRSDGEGGGGGSGGGAGGSHSGVGGRVVEGASSSWAAEESDVFGPPCPPDVGTRGDGGGSAPAGPHSFANGATSEQGCRPAFSLWKSVEKPPEDSAVPGPGIGSSSIGGWVDADADPGESALAQDASNGLLVPVVGRKRPAASAMDAEAGVRSAAAPAPGAARPPQAAQPQQVPGSNDIGEGALPLVDYGDEEDDDADAGDGAPPPAGDADGKLLLRGGTSGDAPRKQLKLDSEGLAPA